MKLSLIAATLMLCSCAAGSTVGDKDTKPTVDAPATNVQLPKAPTVLDDTETSDASVPHCVVDAHWEYNCYVVAIYCEGKTPHIEVSCGPDHPLWPWEIIPDPPYYKNNNRK